MLNRHFTLVSSACEINMGMVDKYMGDGVMLVFGAPEPDLDHAFHAVTCALLIHRLVEHENRKRASRNQIPVEFRIGINTGSMLAGNMGSRSRMEYTVVGDINLASRLWNSQPRNRDFARCICVRIYKHSMAGEYQGIRLRGISQPVHLPGGTTDCGLPGNPRSPVRDYHQE
jgi:adenylate cyclase